MVRCDYEMIYSYYSKSIGQKSIQFFFKSVENARKFLSATGLEFFFICKILPIVTHNMTCQLIELYQLPGVDHDPRIMIKYKRFLLDLPGPSIMEHINCMHVIMIVYALN
ncbi:hypothetical protein DERP_007633 [Dermatophagoides pteronyssinus]|uniref:Uncharacterized protein n=1 Tax=Dermatophagoides pteronyssinus TaxID=6956 RepID=A0ABQ8JL45_DERPT|nr:hypothetical protein DERP_007633 [Dermatophagoides pteronyssinus]